MNGLFAPALLPGAALSARDRRRRARHLQHPTERDRRIGCQVKAARMERGLSRAALAAAVGLSRTAVQRIENGEIRLIASRLCDFAAALDKPIAFFFATIAEEEDAAANGAAKRLATATALAVANPSGNGGAASGVVPGVAGKVTPVRHEFGQQDGSGQEKNRAHLRALS